MTERENDPTPCPSPCSGEGRLGLRAPPPATRGEAGRGVDSRTARTLAVALVYFLHAPLLYLATARFGKGLPIVAFAGIVLAVVLGDRLRDAAPRVARGLSAFYYTALTAGYFVPGYFLFLIAPGFIPVPIVLAAALALATRKRARSIALAYAVLGLLITARLAWFLGGTPPGMDARIAAQPGVRVAVTPEALGDCSWWEARPDVRYFTAPDDSGEWIVGTRGKRPGVFCDNADGRDRRSLALAGDVSDNLVLDSQRNRLFVGDYGAGAVHEVDPSDPAIRKTLEFPGRKVAILRLSPDGKLLYMIADDTSGIYLIDADTLTLIAHAPFPEANTALVLDADRGRLIHLTNHGTVRLLDRFSLHPLKEKRVAGRLYFNAALDTKRNEIVVDSMASGRLFALDRDTLATKRKGHSARGLRHLVYDARRDLLYAANFFTGEVVALAPDDFSERARWYVGLRPRWMELSADGDELRVASAAGGVTVRLPIAIGGERVLDPAF